MDSVRSESRCTIQPGAKRRRVQSPPALNRSSRRDSQLNPNNNTSYGQSQEQRHSYPSWAVSPTTNVTTETGQPEPIAFGSSYCATLSSHNGYREHPTHGHDSALVAKPDGLDFVAQGSIGASETLPIAYRGVVPDNINSPFTSLGPIIGGGTSYNKYFKDSNPELHQGSLTASSGQQQLQPAVAIHTHDEQAGDNRKDNHELSSYNTLVVANAGPYASTPITGVAESTAIANSQILSFVPQHLFATEQNQQSSAFSSPFDSTYLFASGAGQLAHSSLGTTAAPGLYPSVAKDLHPTENEPGFAESSVVLNIHSQMGGGERYSVAHDYNSGAYTQFGVHFPVLGFSSIAETQAKTNESPRCIEQPAALGTASSNMAPPGSAPLKINENAQNLSEPIRRPSKVGNDEAESSTVDDSTINNTGQSNESSKAIASYSKRRGPFNLTKRKETAATRKRKACLRCRVQKIRCDADQNDVDGACLPCKGFSKVSKKTLHNVSCYRGKLTDVVLFRSGGLNLTDRWKGAEMKDVGDRINTDMRTIHVTLGICDKPIVIKVVRFHARAGDVVARFWTVREGERGDEIRKKKDLEPFCLVDIWATAKWFETYIIDNAIATLIKANTPHKLLKDTFAGQDVIHRTYIMAVQYYLSLDDEIEAPAGRIANPQKRLLGNLFVLWMAMRHTTGSAYICSEETLGMRPETKDETYPLFGKVSIPRMVLAQFDSINYTTVLSKFGHKVLRDIEVYVFRNQSTWWWTIYLCIFILLREASATTADRYRHARNNFGGRFRYSIPKFVEELQEGCNNLLVHWHYYNCHPWPNPDAPWERHKHFMAELTSEQHDLVMEARTDPRIQKQLAFWTRYKEGNGVTTRQLAPPCRGQETSYMGSQTRYDWDHPCYWIAQMFEEKWQPHPTYQREYDT